MPVLHASIVFKSCARQAGWCLRTHVTADAALSLFRSRRRHRNAPRLATRLAAPGQGQRCFQRSPRGGGGGLHVDLSDVASFSESRFEAATCERRDIDTKISYKLDSLLPRRHVTATSQYVPNIDHSHRCLNVRVITNSTIALHDSRRITIVVVTLT